MQTQQQLTIPSLGGDFVSDVAVHYAIEQKESLENLGGRYIENYITPEEEKTLLSHIDDNEWLTDLKRRVQHYGYRYDYHARRIVEDMHIGDLPEWVMPLAEQLRDEFFDGQLPDQMIVNEYKPGQGIAPHVDCKACFGAVVASVSLDSTCMMEFAAMDGNSDNNRIRLLLNPRSVVVLTGNIRDYWTHAIAPRKRDRIDGCAYPRARRVSLTFRTVILDE